MLHQYTRWFAASIGLVVLTSATSVVAGLPEGVDLNVFGAASYSYNFDKPAVNAGASDGVRAFAAKHNNFQVDVLNVAVKKGVETKGDVGFRGDLIFGTGVPGAVGTAGAENLLQAYLVYKPCDKSELTIGRFVTHFGGEIIPGVDGHNALATNGLIFYSIPLWHNGAKLSYKLTDSVTTTAIVTNGINDAADASHQKMFGGQVAIAGSEQLSLYLNYLGGKDAYYGSLTDVTHIANPVIVLKPAETTSLMIDGVYVKDGPANSGWGVAGTLQHWYNESHAIALRGEYLNDSDGTFGFATKVYSGTVGHENKLGDNGFLRYEARYDASSDSNLAYGGEKQITAAIQGGFTY